MKQDSTSKFLSIYNEIDHYMRGSLGVEDFVENTPLLRMMADKNRVFASYYRDLRTFCRPRFLNY